MLDGLGRANDTWKITEKLGGTVLDYIVWKIDSDNIAGDLTKEKEGPRKEAKDEIHPPRSSSLAKQVHTRTRIRIRQGVTLRHRRSQPLLLVLLLPRDEFM